MEGLYNEITLYFKNIEMFPARTFYLKSLGDFGGVLYYDTTFGIMAGIKLTDDSVDIDESFNSCKLFSKYMILEKGVSEGKYLFLSCNKSELKNHFAFFCHDYLDPGEDGKKRALILQDPYKWCLEWTSLLGNAVSDAQIYSSIAEMLVLDHIFKQDKTASWHSSKKGSHDIVTESDSAEVKSSVDKGSHKITIHGQFQISGDKPFYLYLIIFEQADTKKNTVSLRSVYEQLIKDGYNKSKLDHELELQGINLYNHKCYETYWVHEKLKYLVDDCFPRLDFTTLPQGIHVNEYQINLDEIPLKGIPWD